MSAIDEYYSEYISETGDIEPQRPKRLYVRRYPVRYTAKGIAWIEACNKRQSRFLDWMLKRVQVSAKKHQFYDEKAT